MTDVRATTGPQERAQPDLESRTERKHEAARDATDAGKDEPAAGSERAAAGVDDLADAVDTAACRLSQLEHQGLADYTHQLASYLSDMSGKLRETNVDELAVDVRRIAQRNPALFLLGSVAVGLGLSYFAKASRDREGVDETGDDTAGRGCGENGAATSGSAQAGTDDGKSASGLPYSGARH
ncbi:MAG: hypothetical protein WD795_09825 [Woeseia sp.]